MAELYGMTVGEWRAMAWWPESREALVMAGYPGHDHEITVNIDGYDAFDQHIPDQLVELLRLLLPETWKLENRGSRIELHPSGRLFGSFSPSDIDLVAQTLPELGLTVVRRGV